MTGRPLLFAFVTLVVCLGLFGLAGAADAQQAASPRRIGVLVVSFSPESREAQAFRQGLLDAGYSRKQVARELHVSISTVQTFIRSAMHKLGADNPIQLGIRYAKSLHESDR